METDIMERREPGRTNEKPKMEIPNLEILNAITRFNPGVRVLGSRNFLFGIFLLLAACGAPLKNSRATRFYNSDKENIRTKAGVTYLGAQPLTGIVFALDANGDTCMLVPFVAGKENGIATAYYCKGKLKEVRTFVNGKKTGRHFGWYENGRPRFEYHYSNDEFDGTYKEWLPDGRLLLSLNFENGHESGLQQTWFENGEIKSNYIIKNARRYGLLGTKNCATVEDSIPR